MSVQRISSFKSFTEVKNQQASIKMHEENKTKREQLLAKIGQTLEEMGVTSLDELDEEKRTALVAKIFNEDRAEDIEAAKVKMGEPKKHEDEEGKAVQSTNESLITEATRSQIGKIDKAGKITSVYVHWDGSPDTRVPLLKNYKDVKTLDKLLDLGKYGISSLEKKIGDKPQDFNNPEKGITVFYGRDRDEKNDMTMKSDVKSITKYLKDAGNHSSAEYVYLFDERDGKWYMADVYDDKELKPIKESVEINEADKPKVGDELTMVKNGKKGKVVKCGADQCDVDFGSGDVYGILYRRIKGDKIEESVEVNEDIDIHDKLSDLMNKLQVQIGNLLHTAKGNSDWTRELNAIKKAFETLEDRMSIASKKLGMIPESVVTEGISDEQKLVVNFLNKIAKEFDYSVKDAAGFVMYTITKLKLNESIVSESSEYVGWAEYKEGKKLIDTFKDHATAEKWSKKNVDSLLDDEKVERVGIMPKSKWDKEEDKHAIKESNVNELVKPKIGDKLTMLKNNKIGKVIKLGNDQCDVDFGNGDVYGITYRRIKGSEIHESEVNEADKPAGLTKDETMKIAQKFADAISKVDGKKVTVNKKTLEEDSFDLDIDGEEFDGGSYMIFRNGNVRNAALSKNPIYGKTTDSVDTIVKNLKSLKESVELNEAKALPLDKLVKMIGDKPSCYDLADFIYTNYDKVTGLRKSMRNDEMDFPSEIEDLVDHYGFDIDEFTDSYGMAAESLEVNEARSINKIQNEWTKVTAEMKSTVDSWKKAEGDAKSPLLAKLKELTAKKNALESELNDAISDKDKDLELVVSEATKVPEGNKFSGALAKAKENGDDEFEVDGETYKVEEAEINEDGGSSAMFSGKGDKLVTYGKDIKTGEILIISVKDRLHSSYPTAKDFEKPEDKRFAAMFGVVPISNFIKIFGKEPKAGMIVKSTNESFEINEEDITSDEQFKEYAFKVLKQAFEADFDEAKAQEVVDGILKVAKGNYGEAVGMLTSSLG